MNDYLSSASVVLHVVGETECLLAEDRGKFLLLLDLLLVKDSAEFVEGILCVTAQSRDVLRGILPDVDGSLCNGRRCPAARIALCGGPYMVLSSARRVEAKKNRGTARLQFMRFS